ncbi:MAG: GFA family protein [Xanthomonadales bacterium]|jgi:hypothetical protein|nr:GFA family protein [Xanthomonadales bacterium]
MRIDGACHCGAIRFTADVDPSRVMLCHCTDCQVLSGSPYRHVVPAAVETFELEGQPKRYVKVAESGNRRVQAFCPECGTPIYSSATESPAWVSIRLGCVRQRAELGPHAQIWHRSAMPWLAALAAVARSPEQQAILAPLPGREGSDK